LSDFGLEIIEKNLPNAPAPDGSRKRITIRWRETN
jgi:hypothetical protein